MPDRTEVGQSVDVLAEILDTVHVQVTDVQTIEVDGALTCHDNEPFNVDVYVVLEGNLILEFSGDRIDLAEGDALAHWRGGESAEAVPIPRYSGIEFLNRAKDVAPPQVGNCRGTVLRCICHFANSEKNPLLSALPQVIRVRSHQWVKAEWLAPTIVWIEREIASRLPGSKVLVNRLLELVWIQLVRTHIATSPAITHGWLRALFDAQIGGALSLIHEQPATQFTVAGLAQAVGMSRSAFASQFTRLVGEPPLHYVARWRMLKASQLLREDRQTLAEVAMAVGYESEAAFSKAFKRWCGQAPGSYRRDMRRESVPAAQMLAG